MSRPEDCPVDLATEPKPYLNHFGQPRPMTSGEYSAERERIELQLRQERIEQAMKREPRPRSEGELAAERERTAGLPPNPKKAFGDKKVPLHLVPPALTIFAALGFRDGAEKYGPFNWRKDPVETGTYYAAALRHLYAWHDGEEIDADSGNHHLAHAAACMAILLDAISIGNAIDTRPPAGPASKVLTEHQR